jgi:hypothetical protein
MPWHDSAGTIRKRQVRAKVHDKVSRIEHAHGSANTEAYVASQLHIAMLTHPFTFHGRKLPTQQLPPPHAPSFAPREAVSGGKGEGGWKGLPRQQQCGS